MTRSAPEALRRMNRAIRRCTACPLWESRTHAVPGEGPPRPRWMLVGEAPGAEEDRTGRPFHGRAGAFLDACLQEAGLSREAVFLTSCVKCRPPKNRDPRAAEARTCIRHYFERQVDLLAPSLVLLCGRVPARYILDCDAPLKTMRRRAFDRERLYRVTYHPAAAMRFQTARACLRDDLARVRDWLDGERETLVFGGD